MSLDRPRRHYTKPPIVEAVIDIQVDVPDATQTAQVDALADKLKGRYASRIPIRQAEMRLEIRPEGTPEFSNQHSILGWRFDTEKKDRVLQIRTGGFTYSHLAPYTDWPTFSAEAKSLWEEYLIAAKPGAVHRIAVRVINRMPQIPEGAQIDEYFNLYPLVPETMSNTLDGMFLQVRSAYKGADPDAKLVLNFYSDQSNSNQFMLDIDLFVDRKIEPNEASVFAILDVLGRSKDDIFERCITDKVREVIK